MATSSLCTQLWTPTPLLEHWLNRVAELGQERSSNQIGVLDDAGKTLDLQNMYHIKKISHDCPTVFTHFMKATYMYVVKKQSWKQLTWTWSCLQFHMWGMRWNQAVCKQYVHPMLQNYHHRLYPTVHCSRPPDVLLWMLRELAHNTPPAVLILMIGLIEGKEINLLHRCKAKHLTKASQLTQVVVANLPGYM